MLLFPEFGILDVFGPLDALDTLSGKHQCDLSIIAASLDPISTSRSPRKNPKHSTFGASIVPTHTFANIPPLDVLLVPGGRGVEDVGEEAIAFIRETYPSLKYLISVCNGSGLLARAGVLDSKRATTNKELFAKTAALGPKTQWVTHARWVTDGNIWTSSGVSAGIDVTLAWIEEVFGKELATVVANGMEYERHLDSSNDPFAELWNLTKSE